MEKHSHLLHPSAAGSGASWRYLLLVQPSPEAELTRELEQLGFDVRRARLDAAASASGTELPVDVAIVDCRGSEAAGLEACRRLRASEHNASVPLIVIAKGDDKDWRSEAIEAGADALLADSESLVSFLSQFKALNNRIEQGREDILRYADVQLDLKRFKVRRGGRVVPLTAMQMRLLKHFLEHPTIVFSRRELLSAVWRNEQVDEGAVTACVARVRRALNAGGGPELIRSIPTEGYALVADGDA